MFGSVQRVCGSPRLYPVTDRVTAHHVMEHVRKIRSTHVVHKMQWRDLDRLAAVDRALAINPCGRQCHLVLCKYAGTNCTFIVHVPTCKVDLVPLRFSNHLFDEPKVFHCTLSQEAKLLVVNDRCGVDAHDASMVERLRCVHDLVHTHHTPDAALFPCRLVARRCFALSQLDDVQHFIDHCPAKIHSVSLIAPSMHQAEKRILVSRLHSSTTKVPKSLRPGYCMDALVVAASGPDAYKVMIAPDTWEYLSVKTLAESKVLRTKNLVTPSKITVAWDGSGWRAVA